MMTLNYTWKLARDQNFGFYSLVIEDYYLHDVKLYKYRPTRPYLLAGFP